MAWGFRSAPLAMSARVLLAHFADADLREHRRIAPGAILIYLILAAALAWMSRHRLGADTICYIQMARHMQEGEFGLAVNSWWSPGLPGLLIPGMPLGFDGLVWARLVQVPAGLCFAFGASALLRRFQGGAGTLAAFILALCAALAMQGVVLTPDACHAAVLTWYFVIAHSLLELVTIRRSALAGVLGGVAYLTKAYSLPFVVAHLTATYFLSQLRRSERLPVRRVVGCWALALALVFAVSGPWILVISRHDGEFTISSAGRYWTVAEPIDSREVPLVTRLYAVPAGRWAALENIHDLPLEWKPAPPFGSWGWQDRLKAIRRNVNEIGLSLDRLDGVGVTKMVLLLCLAVAVPLRGLTQDRLRLSVSWGLLSLAIYLGGYAVVHFEDRFLWAIWGLMMVLAIAGPETIRRRLVVGDAESPPLQQAKALFRLWHGVFLSGLSFLVLTSIGVRTGAYVAGGSYRLAADLQQTGRQIPSGRVVSSTDWATGLYLAFWSHGTCLGAPTNTTADGIAQELRPFGSCLFFVPRRPELSKALGSNASFKRVKVGSSAIDAFEFNSAPQN